jgi:hypothetical protein
MATECVKSKVSWDESHVIMTQIIRLINQFKEVCNTLDEIEAPHVKTIFIEKFNSVWEAPSTDSTDSTSTDSTDSNKLVTEPTQSIRTKITRRKD